MIEIKYTERRFEINYRIKKTDLSMSIDEMISHIENNGEIHDRVGFVVPFSVYYEAKEHAERIDRVIEHKARRRV